jgi:hypothetical protein
MRLRHQEVLYANQPAAHWVHRDRLRLRLFPCTRVSVCLIYRSPDSCYGFGLILLSCDSSSEFLRSLVLTGDPFGSRLCLALGFRPSSRHHSSASTSRWASRAPLRSVLRLSQPLDGFFRSRARRLIPSRCHVQGLSRSGAFSPCAATLPHREEPAPLPLLRRSLTAVSQLAPLHFRGHVRRLSTSRLRSAPGRVPRVRLFTSPDAAPLFEFLLLQVSSFLDVGSDLLGAFRSWCSRTRSLRSRPPRRAHLAMLTSMRPLPYSPRPFTSSVFSSRNSVISSPNLPTCSSFRTSHPMPRVCFRFSLAPDD